MVYSRYATNNMYVQMITAQLCTLRVPDPVRHDREEREEGRVRELIEWLVNLQCGRSSNPFFKSTFLPGSVGVPVVARSEKSMIVRVDPSASACYAEFDALVEKELAKWKVPGLTVAVIHGSQSFTKAYGVAEYPDKKMTTTSLFSTCSTTKAFTAAAMSLIIEDSKATSSPISWDTPLSSIIRDDFVLADEYATAHTTIEDALSHRTGLPSHWPRMRLAQPEESLQDAVRKMRYLPLAYAPRTTFEYNNYMYIAVSHAVEQMTGERLGSFLKRRIWDPLGMEDTYFDVQQVTKDLERKEQLVRGYTWVPELDDYKAEPYMNYVPITGTGAIVSNILDYEKWLRALLAQSSPLSPEGHTAMLQPRTILTSLETAHPPINCHHLYGLGWFVENYCGELFYWHSGSWPGFGILIGFIPSKQFGFVMMGNTQDARMAERTLYMHLIEKILGLSPARTDAETGTETSKTNEPTETAEAAKKRLIPSFEHYVPHSLPLEEYAGTYTHPAYGSIKFEHSDSDSALRADHPDRVLATRIDLNHTTAEFFLAKVSRPGWGETSTEWHIAEFHISAPGSVNRVGFDFERALKGGEKIWFEREI